MEFSASEALIILMGLKMIKDGEFHKKDKELAELISMKIKITCKGKKMKLAILDDC